MRVFSLFGCGPAALDGMRIHTRHLRRILGPGFRVEQINLTHLQDYVHRRGKGMGLRGNRISPRTIKKEIVTLSSVWRSAEKTPYTTISQRDGRSLSGKEQRKTLLFTDSKKKWTGSTGSTG